MLLLILALPAIHAIAQVPLPLIPRSVSQRDWNALNISVDGRLFEGVPFARSCFVQSSNSSACEEVRVGYRDEGKRIFTWYRLYTCHDTASFALECTGSIHTNTVGDMPDNG